MPLDCLIDISTLHIIYTTVQTFGFSQICMFVFFFQKEMITVRVIKLIKIYSKDINNAKSRKIYFK